MSISSTFDIILQIDSIRSIDVLSQGLYYLKFELYYLKLSGKVSAFPYNILTCPQRPSVSLTPPSTDNNSYMTQTFLIKFFDEVIHLNEICFFRISNEISLHNDKFELVLNCKLMFHPATITWNEEVLQETCDSLENFQEKLSLYYTIVQWQNGFHQFLPIVLTSGVSLLVNTCVHAFVSGYSFGPPASWRESSFAKIKLKDLKNQDFHEKLTIGLFGPTTKISKKTLLEIYEKLVIGLAEYYQATKKTCEEILQFAKIKGNPLNLADLSDEISEFNRNISGDLRKPNDSFIFVSVEESTKLIGKGLWSITKNLSRLLEYFTRTLQTTSDSIVSFLLPDYNTKLSSILNKRKVYTRLKCADFLDVPLENHSLRHIYIAEDFRKLLQCDIHPELKTFPRLESTPNDFPFIFVDTIQKPDAPESPKYWMHYVKKVNKGQHLVVLVHGLYGNSADMRLIRNTLYTLWPNINVLCSYYNEGKTEGKIEKMGKRLAQEITKYVNDHFYSDSLNRLSFIGYSLGGLIARASLLYMPDYLHTVHFLITLSTPHLGCYLNTSKLVDAGMWIIQKFKRSKSLSQLALTDAKQVKDSFIYKLGLSDEIQRFKHVALVSSCQDKYSPVYSSRIEAHFGSGSEKEKLQAEIANSILGKMSCKELIRMDANFMFSGKGLDNAIGRAAHIEMVDNKHLIELVLHECSHFFSIN